MPDPSEPLKLLVTPNNGADVGSWDQPVNNDFIAVAGMLGGVVTKALTNANVTLTKPTGTVTPGTGPTECQNFLLRFTGTLTGNCVITIPLPGYYVAENRCTVGAFSVKLASSSPGEVIGLPPGQAVTVYNDGTNVRFVDMPAVGSPLFLYSAAIPAWHGACTVRPWLLCDGTVYNISDYPFLGALLGSQFGGDGATTFGVPDARGRAFTSIDPTGTRITTLGSGVDGATIASTGGSQNQMLSAGQMPQQTTGTESATHTHTYDTKQSLSTFGGGAANFAWQGSPPASGVSSTESATHTHVVGNVNPTPVITLPPVLISGLTFIKT